MLLIFIANTACCSSKSDKNILLPLQTYARHENYYHATSNSFHLFKYNMQSHRLTMINSNGTHVLNPVISHSGNKFIYSTENSKHLLVYVTNLQFSHKHKLLSQQIYSSDYDPDPIYNLEYTWSDNDRFIAISYTGTHSYLRIYNTRNFQRVYLKKHLYAYKWNPNCNQITVQSTSHSKLISIINLSGSKVTLDFQYMVVAFCYLDSSHILFSLYGPQYNSNMGHFGLFKIYNSLTHKFTSFHVNNYPKQGKNIKDKYLILDHSYDMDIDFVDSLQMYRIPKNSSVCLLNFLHIMSNGPHYALFELNIQDHKLVAVGDAEYCGRINNSDDMLLMSYSWFGPYKRPGGAFLTTVWLENMYTHKMQKLHLPYSYVANGE